MNDIPRLAPHCPASILNRDIGCSLVMSAIALNPVELLETSPVIKTYARECIVPSLARDTLCQLGWSYWRLVVFFGHSHVHIRANCAIAMGSPAPTRK